MFLSTPSITLLILFTNTVLSTTLKSSNPNRLLLHKRKEGYQPTQETCGPGSTCSVSCGAEYETCDSTDGFLHCYDPTILNQNCCRDGTGNACRENYYCTSDSSLQTWCCPDGMDLITCAKQYGLTDTLVSQQGSPTGKGHVPSGVLPSGAVPTGADPSGNPHSPDDTDTHMYPYPNATHSYPYHPTGTGIGTGIGTGTGVPTTSITTVCVGGGCTSNNGGGNGGGGPTHTPTRVTSLPPAFTNSVGRLRSVFGGDVGAVGFLGLGLALGVGFLL